MRNHGHHEPSPLLDQEQALGAYLQALLDVPDSKHCPQPVTGETAAAAGAAWRLDAPIQGLLVTVRGVRLVLPVDRLGGVVPLAGAALGPTQDGNGFVLGSFIHQDRRILLVDTAGVIFPPEHRHRQAGQIPAYTHGVLVGGTRLALGCEAVGEPLTLPPESIKWRSYKGKRPWLAGTVRDRMCALLDPDALVALAGLAGGSGA